MTFGLSREDYVRSLVAEARSITDKAYPTSAELGRARNILNQLQSYAKTRRENDAFKKAVSFADAVTDTKDIHLTNDSAFYDAQAEKQGKGKLSSVLISDPGYKSWYQNVAPSGTISDTMKGLQSPPVQHRVGLKTLLTGASDTSAGAMVFPETAPFVGLAGRRELTLRDLVTIVPVQTDSVQFAKEDTETNAAATVAEATATSGSSGLKPESTKAFVAVSVAIRTLAHWLPATKRALADAPQLRQLIDGFLLHGLQEELEDQMLSGGGTGENFTGLAITSGTQTQAFSENNLATMLKGRNKVQVIGHSRPNAFLLHPTDWENVLLWRDTTANFMMLSPSGPFSNPTVWGLPVVLCEGLSPGTGWVGDFRELILFDRESAQISVSDSHESFFTRNMVAILAELRAGFCVRRPAALTKLTLSLGGS
jgi:HK97 family phage major capsid protein